MAIEGGVVDLTVDIFTVFGNGFDSVVKSILRSFDKVGEGVFEIVDKLFLGWQPVKN